MKRTGILFLISYFTIMVFSTNYRFVLGTYTQNTGSDGIYFVDVNISESLFNITPITTKNVENPSYLSLSADKKYLYSVNELGTDSYVSAFAFDGENKTLHFLNKVKSVGADPCFISVTNKHVVTANYSGGNVSVFERLKDGRITDSIQNIQHSGSSINKKRQNEPHVHQTIFDPAGKYLFVNDLGTDCVISYKYQPNDKKGKIFVELDTLSVKKGSGPRHIAFSKNGKFGYLIQELDGSLTTFGIKNGKMNLINETTVVHKPEIISGAADIHLSPDGKFLYATNRGTANDISIFKINANGVPEFKRQVPVMGNGPRNFAITKDGNYLMACNQKSNEIVMFKRDMNSGDLVDSGIRISVNAPVCLIEL